MLKQRNINGGTMSDSKSAMIKALDQWFEAYNNKDVDGVLSYHTEDSSLFAPNAPRVDGVEGIRGTILGMLDSGINVLSHEVTEADCREDLGYLLAKGTLDIPATGKVNAKIIDILKRQSDGSWKFYATSWNLDS